MSPLTEILFSEKYIKRLVGRTEIEDALKRLDKLTQEEARMANAQVLKVAHVVDDRVKGVADEVAGVGARVAAVDTRVAGVDDRVANVDARVASVDTRVAGVDDRVAGVDDRVAGIDDRVKAVDDKVAAVIDGAHYIFNRPRKVSDSMRLDGKEVKAVMQQTATGVDQVKRLSSLNRIDIRYVGSTIITGNQVRRDLRKWLSPPDPSTNHNIACGAHHKGTATWFFQGSIYEEWKSTPSLIWIHGKRASLSYLLPNTA